MLNTAAKNSDRWPNNEHNNATDVPIMMQSS